MYIFNKEQVINRQFCNKLNIFVKKQERSSAFVRDVKKFSSKKFGNKFSRIRQ